MKKTSSSTLPTQTSLFMEIKSNSSSSNLHKYLDSSTQKIFKAVKAYLNLKMSLTKT